jgi:hypothetical protein
MIKKIFVVASLLVSSSGWATCENASIAPSDAQIIVPADTTVDCSDINVIYTLTIGGYTLDQNNRPLSKISLSPITSLSVDTPVEQWCSDETGSFSFSLEIDCSLITTQDAVTFGLQSGAAFSDMMQISVTR